MTVSNLDTKVGGWLCPNGEFMECALYRHIEIVLENPDFIKKVPKLGEIKSSLEDIRRDCHKRAAQEGSHCHAEWHLYDMAVDDSRLVIRELLLDEGFIRVGSFDQEIYFEGRPSALKSQYQTCKDFADSYDATANFEPVPKKEH